MASYSDVVIKRINDICQERNITINKLATTAGMRQSTISNVMNKYTKIPNLRTLHRIAVGLGMTVSELLDFPEMNETIFDDE